MKKVLLMGVFIIGLLWPVRSWAYQPDNSVIEISYEDAQMLMKVAQAEAGNQGFVGQWLVICCVYNRTLSDDFPSTVKEVIYQEGQFSTVENGSYDKAEPTADTHYALAYFEQGNRAENIVAFESAKSQSLEKYFWRAFEYRDHVFYTMKQ